MTNQNHFEQILAFCLEALETGQWTLDECLSRYPQYAAELRPLLETALALQALPQPQPRTAFQQNARQQLLEKINQKEFVTFSGQNRHSQQIANKRTDKSIQLLRRFNMTWIVILSLIGTLLGGGTVYASQSALPGDALYSVKLGVEEARLALAGPQSEAQLLQEFAMERLEETEMLLQQNRVEDVAVALQDFQEMSTGLQTALQEQNVPQEQIQQTLAAMQAQMEAIAAQLQMMQQQMAQNGTEGMGEALAAQEQAQEQLMESLQHALEAQERSMEALHNLMSEIEDSADDMLTGTPAPDEMDDDMLTGTPDPDEMDDEHDDMMTPTPEPGYTPSPTDTPSYDDYDDEEHSDYDYNDEEHDDVEDEEDMGQNGNGMSGGSQP